MKESIKRTTEWAAYYHTSRRSWYPKPEETIPFSRVLTIKPLPVAEMSQAECDVLRNWASSYGAEVRQRTVRQETTMAKHGTLPEFIYQRQCVTSDKPITFALGQYDERLDNAEVDDEEIEDDFDSSSDEELQTKMVTEETHSCKEKLEARQLSSLVHGLDLVELFASIIVFFVE